MLEVTAHSVVCVPHPSQLCDTSTDGTIYKYYAKSLNSSRSVNFTDYAGKTVLFVNVATYWGLTSQYVGKERWCLALFHGANVTFTTLSPCSFHLPRTECTARRVETLWLHYPRLSLQPVRQTGAGAETWNPTGVEVRTLQTSSTSRA